MHAYEESLALARNFTRWAGVGGALPQHRPFFFKHIFGYREMGSSFMLSTVIPCYNEEDGLMELHRRIGSNFRLGGDLAAQVERQRA